MNSALAERHGHSLRSRPGGGKFVARSGKKTVDHFVRRVRIVMKENQIPYFALPRNLHAFEPARMPPPASFRGQLFWRILRVVDEDVRAMHQFPQILVEFRD